MALQSFGFVGEDYKDYSPRVGVEETRNLYPAIVASPTARKRIVLQNVPGLELINNFGAAGEAPAALFYDEGRLWVVSHGHFSEARYTGGSTQIGDVARGAARIVSNGRQGHQIIISAGMLGYVYDTQTGVFAQITDTAFPAQCRTIEYVAGYAVALDDATGQIVVSDPFDATAYSGLAVSIRQLTADKVIHIGELGGDLWFFGTKTIDVWRNTGNTVSIFEPIVGSTIPRGLRSPDSVVKIAGGWAFVGDGEHGGMSVFHTEGYNAIQISTPAIDFRLRGYQTVGVSGDYAHHVSLLSLSRAYGYEEGGHAFYVLVAPNLKTCFVYDFTTNLWHERNHWDNTRGEGWQAHIGRCHVWAFDEHMIGGENGIYRQSLDIHTFEGRPRRWLRRSPHVGDGAVPTFHRRLHLDMEVGAGGTGYDYNSEYIMDPSVMLRYSNDFGNTWIGPRTARVGKRGAYDTSVDFWGLGRSKGARVYEVSGHYPAKTVISEALLDISEGAF